MNPLIPSVVPWVNKYWIDPNSIFIRNTMEVKSQIVTVYGRMLQQPTADHPGSGCGKIVQ